LFTAGAVNLLLGPLLLGKVPESLDRKREQRVILFAIDGIRHSARIAKTALLELITG
jgi:hypothetical protein